MNSNIIGRNAFNTSIFMVQDLAYSELYEF